MICMTEKNPTTSVKISLSAKNCLDKLVSERGIGKIELVSRSIEWLAQQVAGPCRYESHRKCICPLDRGKFNRDY